LIAEHNTEKFITSLYKLLTVFFNYWLHKVLAN